MGGPGPARRFPLPPLGAHWPGRQDGPGGREEGRENGAAEPGPERHPARPARPEPKLLGEGKRRPREGWWRAAPEARGVSRRPPSSPSGLPNTLHDLPPGHAGARLSLERTLAPPCLRTVTPFCTRTG